jgi:hypothetical protein
MTMHGMFWDFPGNFNPQNSAGIRPKSAYLKVIGDFTRWKDQLVFGCDDSAQREFLNKRHAKGDIEGPGQSNSNLWFTDLNLPDRLGPATANGALWLEDAVNANEPSDPMLFEGWDFKTVWIKNHGDQRVTFFLETDKSGDGQWAAMEAWVLDPGKSNQFTFGTEQGGEWFRVKTDKNTIATVHIAYTDKDERHTHTTGIFDGVLGISENEYNAGLLYGLGDNRRKLGLAGLSYSDKEKKDIAYYELDEKLNLVKTEDIETFDFIKNKFAIPEQVFKVEEGSVLIVDDLGRRWRLPLGDEAFTEPSLDGRLRICREVATERDLFNCHGTFYELPAENADGYAKIRPIASHKLRINDYASYRGLLVMTGVDPARAGSTSHVIKSDDGQLAIWAGAIDDLWKLGRPVGDGGPWVNTMVTAENPSDPYLFGFYEEKSLEISHDSPDAVTFTIEFEPIGHGPWMEYKEVIVQPGETFSHRFPEGLQARWIRFTTDKDCKATTWLEYR